MCGEGDWDFNIIFIFIYAIFWKYHYFPDDVLWECNIFLLRVFSCSFLLCFCKNQESYLHHYNGNSIYEISSQYWMRMLEWRWKGDCNYYRIMDTDNYVISWLSAQWHFQVKAEDFSRGLRGSPNSRIIRVSYMEDLNGTLPKEKMTSCNCLFRQKSFKKIFYVPANDATLEDAQRISQELT